MPLRDGKTLAKALIAGRTITGVRDDDERPDIHQVDG